MKDSTKKLGFEHLSDLAAALEKILRSMANPSKTASNQKLMLLEKTARALAMAAAMGSSASGAASGISAEIDRAGRRTEA